MRIGRSGGDFGGGRPRRRRKVPWFLRYRGRFRHRAGCYLATTDSAAVHERLAAKNSANLETTSRCWLTWSWGNIGSDKISAATRSVTGNAPFLKPRPSYAVCKCKGIG